MDWQKVGTHGMKSGEYRVAKNFVDGCPLYALYFGDELLKWCNDFGECKDAAEAHAKRNGGFIE